jgi:hypothetical protein
MELFSYGVAEDFGKEYYLNILNYKNRRECFSVMQLSLEVSSMAKWKDPPYLLITMGHGKLFSFLLILGKLGFSFELVSRTWIG